YVTDWFGQLGKVFVFSFIFGSILLFYDMVSPLRSKKTKQTVKKEIKAVPGRVESDNSIQAQIANPLLSTIGEGTKIKYEGRSAKIGLHSNTIILTLVFAIFILGYTFSRYSAGSIFNGTSSVSLLIFYGSIMGFGLFIMCVYLWSYYKDKEVFDKITSLDMKYTFVFVWFLVMIFAATSAIRLLFEFSVIISILSAFLIISLIDYSFKLKNKILKYGALVVIAILLINPFAFAQGFLITYYNRAFYSADNFSPRYNFQWQHAGQWVRENTPEDAVFAHWWDYGYWVQSGFDRTTITDGGNFHGWWNYLMGRLVLTGQTDEEGLGYLYAHNASYLLMVSDEIGKYPAYSSIGSDSTYDRYSSIPFFTYDPRRSTDRDGGLEVFYFGGAGVDQAFTYNGLDFDGNDGIGAFVVPFKDDNGALSIGRPIGIFVHDGEQVNVPVNCVYFEGRLIDFGSDGYDGCLRIIPSIEGNEVNALSNLLLLSPKVKDSLFARLYLMNQGSRYYELVYGDERSIPLAIFAGRIVGPHKIWKINYPRNFEISEEDFEYYTRFDYPDPRLQLP
ncbi:MAG: hypothetical protein AABW46_02020, partial [Nanoarchaeota archaeon]